MNRVQTELRDEEMAMLRRVAAEHPRPLVFATISGAHLYGFPSPDSDFDLRGAHVATAREAACVGEPAAMGTLQREGVVEGREIDLVTHEARKFFGLLLKKNGYVLEQVLSPLVVAASPEHEELKAIARECVTRYHGFHYIGFSRTQRGLLKKEDPPRVKPLLYVYRVLLTGIHLMRTGEVEANLVKLNEGAGFGLPYIGELIERKVTGEQATLEGVEMGFHEAEHERLTGELERAMAASSLPDGVEDGMKGALDDLLFRLRAGAQPVVPSPSVVGVDLREVHDEAGFHDVFARAFGFPDFYGRNMDAWVDCMSDLDYPPAGMTAVHVPQGQTMAVRLVGFESLRHRAPRLANALIDAVANVNERKLEDGDAPVIALAC